MNQVRVLKALSLTTHSRRRPLVFFDWILSVADFFVNALFRNRSLPIGRAGEGVEGEQTYCFVG